MVLSIVNHKGGAGKTTTTINLGAALALEGYRVVLIDFDAQGSLTYAMGIDDSNPTIADALMGDRSVTELIVEREGMHIVPAGTALADVEFAFAKSEDRLNHLKDLVANLPDADFVLIDCPPSLSLLTLNALVASDEVLIPMQLDVLSLRGLDMMLDTIRKISPLNPALSVMSVVPIMVDPRKNINKEILSHIRENYAVPISKQSIRTSVKAAEAPSFGKSVIRYSPGSTTATDFRLLAREVAKLAKQKEVQQ